MKKNANKPSKAAAKLWKKILSWTWIVLIVLAAFLLGYLFRPAPSVRQQQNRSAELPAPEKKQLWTCSMHPQIRQPKPGKCPSAA